MKWWKWVLITFGVIILGVVGTIYYFFELKQYDIADAEVEQITQTEYDIVLPPNIGEENPIETAETTTDEDTNTESATTVVTTGTDTNEKNNGSANQGDHDTSQEKPQESKTTNPTESPNDKPDSSKEDKDGESEEKEPVITATYIKDRYRPTFESLQSQANSRLDALISKALGEYRAKKEKGESVSFGYFYQKYKGAADELEANTDATFNSIITALNKELKENGFSTNESKEFITYYEAQKEHREDALLDKARDLL